MGPTKLKFLTYVRLVVLPFFFLLPGIDDDLPATKWEESVLGFHFRLDIEFYTNQPNAKHVEKYNKRKNSSQKVAHI